MKKVIIIPARYNSSRLPGKPLLDIQGKPMIIRVCDLVPKSLFSHLYVATDSEKIFESVTSAGFSALMTAEHHVSGTDRLQEAADQLDLAADDIVINLQGDEPLMPKENLIQVAELLERNSDASVATLYDNATLSDLKNPNVVKVVSSREGRALYFSRSAIPHMRDEKTSHPSFKRHVGLYAYKKQALDEFVSWEESHLERIEKLEQLRFMENDRKIVIAQASFAIPAGVDTQSDLEEVRKTFSETKQ